MLNIKVLEEVDCHFNDLGFSISLAELIEAIIEIEHREEEVIASSIIKQLDY